MSTCVCVLSNSGERLMPTFRLGKVRRLLKDGKAKIVKHHPFTIQLLYDSKTNTQPIEICEDVGYNYIGISVKSESHEYVSAQYDTLQDEKEHHDDCRKYRRTRRNRLRYRKPRFDNRKRGEGWLAPSLEHKKQLNIRLIERYVSVIPITRATVEVGSFDTMLLQAIQKGGKLFGFGEDKEFANLSGAAFMNTVRWQIVNALYATYGKEFVTITYGAMTKEKRIALQLEKTHSNDAYAMGNCHPAHRCVFRHYQKRRRNNRVLEKFYDATYIDTRTGNKAKGKELFNGRISRNHKKDSESLHKYRSKKGVEGASLYKKTALCNSAIRHCASRK